MSHIHSTSSKIVFKLKNQDMVATLLITAINSLRWDIQLMQKVIPEYFHEHEQSKHLPNLEMAHDDEVRWRYSNMGNKAYTKLVQGNPPQPNHRIF